MFNLKISFRSICHTFRALAIVVVTSGGFGPMQAQASQNQCEGLFVLQTASETTHYQNVANAIIEHVRQTGKKLKVSDNEKLYKQHANLKDRPEYLRLLKAAPDAYRIVFADRRKLVAQRVNAYVRKYGTLPQKAIDANLYQQHEALKRDPKYLKYLSANRKTAKIIEEQDKPYPDIVFHRILWHIKSHKDVPSATAPTEIRRTYQKIFLTTEFIKRLSKDIEAWAIYRRSHDGLVKEDGIAIRDILASTGLPPSPKKNRRLYTLYYLNKFNPELYDIVSADPRALNALQNAPKESTEILGEELIQFCESYGVLPTVGTHEQLSTRLHRYKRDPLFLATVGKSTLVVSLLEQAESSSTLKFIDDMVDFLISTNRIPNQTSERSLYERYLRYRSDPTVVNVLSNHEVVGELYRSFEK